ncbi:hypothetical protein [Streptomyces sp. NPDC050264]|uniref:hypothetical protein n=1 Tax=Streptomyces sp. NPDC050264 TaxID=3155038 RepID=UPI00344ACFD0
MVGTRIYDGVWVLMAQQSPLMTFREPGAPPLRMVALEEDFDPAELDPYIAALEVVGRMPVDRYWPEPWHDEAGGVL